MKTNFNSESWRSILPEVYNWSDSVSLQISQDPPSRGLFAVLLAESDDSQAALSLNAPSLSDGMQKKILDAVAVAGWKGSGSILVTVDNLPVIVVAPSKLKVTTHQRSRAVGLEVAKHVKTLKHEQVSFCKGKGFCTIEMFLGLGNGLYSTIGFKSTGKDTATKNPLPKTVTLVGSTAKPEELVEAKYLVKCTTLTRHLQDAPGNYLNPVKFGEIAADVAKECGLKSKIMGREEMKKLGMGSFLSVNDGSVIEPRLIVLEIDGKNNDKTLAYCGKGLTFDAGGISIKPSAQMEEMKYDMSGGAAVLGTAMFLAKYKPNTKVVCIIGATENLPSGSATKPGDIVVAMNGKTIEVQNTDAEGRLVLADLLCYANTEYKPDTIVDIATLTGAVLMALGTVGSAILSNDDTTADFIYQSSQKVGEPMWRLPMWPELDNEVKGATADLNNIAKGNVKAGTIIGAVFLKEFVGKTKWAHLDIAGTGWDCKATGYPSSGGSAFGMRTLIEAARRFE